MRKPLFYNFRPPIFGIKNQSTNHVFSSPLLGPRFSNFFDFSPNGRFGDPFKIQRAPKSADTGRCQALSDKGMSNQAKWPEPELSGTPWIMISSPCEPRRSNFSSTICFFFFFVPRLLSAPQNIEKTSLPKSIKSQNISPWTPKAWILIPFWHYFDFPFQSIFLST